MSASPDGSSNSPAKWVFQTPFQVRTLRSREGEQYAESHTARSARGGMQTSSTRFRSLWNTSYCSPRALNLGRKTDPKQPDPRFKAATGWGGKSPWGWGYFILLPLPLS